MASQPTGHVFISYAREDHDYVRYLADSLHERGFEIWVDDGVGFDDRWWQSTVQAVRSSAAFVIVMTPRSEASEWIERVTLLALREQKPVFPLLLRGKPFPLLITTQYFDVTSGKMPPQEFYTQLEWVASSVSRPPTRTPRPGTVPDVVRREPAVPRIFISYRRDDSAGYAGRLYDRLSDQFDQNQVFMDVGNIEPGLDFVETIESAVSSVDVLIAVIGKQWLTITDSAGRRRLENPEDIVQLEIATAINRNIRVIPALVGGAIMPRSTDLPESLKNLARRSAIEISDTRFHYDVDRLIEVLEKVLTT
jgi:hypothetical protein